MTGWVDVGKHVVLHGYNLFVCPTIMLDQGRSVDQYFYKILVTI